MNHLVFFFLLSALFQLYSEKRRQYTLVRNNPTEIVEKVASDIEKLLSKKKKALEVREGAR